MKTCEGERPVEGRYVSIYVYDAHLTLCDVHIHGKLVSGEENVILNRLLKGAFVFNSSGFSISKPLLDILTVTPTDSRPVN